MPRANLIIQSKVPAFIALFEKIEQHAGGLCAACKATGVHEKTFYRMKHSHFLTDTTARKILTTYKRTSRICA
ncbi:hypothetical protein [Polynucleobacter sp. UK-Kesae-W10]|uniref:hypothetical protein n=1 Tax=Polynucleobacter sp. UK-Kesae-W10 TaxID=1819738 RepID=UPI001C0CF6A0|nr:hypothetical protein [Polynucleobacter sp. UK-Kesae-W10]MBU3577560.1 hypothetical protein [Polynucleobacter sp. UK-Kesae-W10]